MISLRTKFNTTLEAEVVPGDNKGSFYHLKINVYPSIDTDVVTTIRINTIESEDIEKLSRRFSALAKSLKELETNQKNKK